MTAAGAGGGAAAAAAAKAAARQRRKRQWEIITMQEPITCPVCERGKLVPLLSQSSTNWVCSQPDCDYVIHQHGSDNTKVWKGRARREDKNAPDSWLNTP